MCRQPALVAGAAPATVRTASPDVSRRAPCGPKPRQAACFERGRVLDLGVEVRGARHLGGVGRNRHRSQHQSRCRQSHSEFSHKTLLHFCWGLPNRTTLLRRCDNEPPIAAPAPPAYHRPGSLYTGTGAAWISSSLAAGIGSPRPAGIVGGGAGGGRLRIVPAWQIRTNYRSCNRSRTRSGRVGTWSYDTARVTSGGSTASPPRARRWIGSRPTRRRSISSGRQATTRSAGTRISRLGRMAEFE